MINQVNYENKKFCKFARLFIIAKIKEKRNIKYDKRNCKIWRS